MNFRGADSRRNELGNRLLLMIHRNQDPLVQLSGVRIVYPRTCSKLDIKTVRVLTNYRASDQKLLNCKELFMIAPCGVNSTGNFWTGGSFSVHYYPADLPVTAAALEGGRASDSLSHATHFVPERINRNAIFRFQNFVIMSAATDSTVTWCDYQERLVSNYTGF